MASDRIFISYTSANRQVAEGLYDYLGKKGLPCWMAPRDVSSGNYAGEITRALKAAALVIIVCSKESCRSEHVKNEVTLAFNNKKPIIPYCLEANPFDDDLEYYLSAKQHIVSTGSRHRDYELIEKMVREFLHTEAAPEEPSRPRRSGWWILSLVLLVLLVGAFWLWMHKRPVETPPPLQADSTQIVQAEPAPEEKPKTVAPTSPKASFVFTGKLRNGYPDGYGTLTFKKARRIDMHDPEAREAAAGDYITGDWKDGHLNFGEWYNAAGEKKGFLQLGDYPDTGADHILGKCGKP